MPLNKTRLTYLWLLPLNFILFLSFLRYFLHRLYTSILSVPLFPPSYSSFLCVFTYRYVSVFVHVHLRCYATVLVHGGTSIPFGTFLDHVEVILLYHADWEWIRIPFESWYPFVADVSRRKIDFSREGRERGKKICRYHKERKENVSSIVLDFFFHTRYNNHFYIFTIKKCSITFIYFLWLTIFLIE